VEDSQVAGQVEGQVEEGRAEDGQAEDSQEEEGQAEESHLGAYQYMVRPVTISAQRERPKRDSTQPLVFSL
jgi:hypothetical protein